ncbi:TetR family transcriptional regulator [Eubacterium xylanophilum]|uniref:TetR family transcriptional regulator n=1 Tax=Eubacterium xylanophilum TaxID=39497 RepID=UPI00047C9BE5|nr:TetR family transcriptional regulator [Eubacterium xylanophilum]
MIHKQTTKEVLSASIHDLATTKPFSKITIREIAYNCGVSATTFYNHFHDKFDLIIWEFNIKIENIYKKFEDGEITWKGVIVELIELFGDDQQFYINAIRDHQSGNLFFETKDVRAIELFTDIVEKRTGKKPSEEINFDLTLYVKGISYCIAEWYVNTPEYSKEALAEYLYNIRPSKLQDIIK